MVILKKFGLQNDSYRWLYHVNLRFYLASETQPGCLKTYVELCSEWQDDSNSSSTSVRYGYIGLGGLRTGVDESIVTSYSSYFGYVYNGNVNAASSRSSSRSKTHDNLMTEELFNCDNFYKAFSLPLLNVSHIASAAGLNTVLSTGKAFTSPVISPFCRRSMISSITASECII